ncbi:MAG TPA: protein-S-isoprenylcysteine methyltransferase, partial [Croceibacterium sp.]
MSAQPTRAGGLPASDVSSAVGLVGLAGLAAWIALCRAWPAIADALSLPGPRERVAGPFAALGAMAFAGMLMALWSVLVEKVHRNPSTGIDWHRPRPLAASLHVSGTKLAGLWSTWAIIGFLYCLGRWYWNGQYLFAMHVIGWAALPIFVLSVPYVLWLDRVLIEPRDHAWHFGAMLIGREPWDAGEVTKHWRAWIIKGFFGAFMISILPAGFAAVVSADWSQVIHDPV